MALWTLNHGWNWDGMVDTNNGCMDENCYFNREDDYNPVDFVVITLSSDRPPYMLSNQGCQQIHRKERGLSWFHIYPNDGCCWIEWGNSWLVIRLSTSKDGGTRTWGFKRDMSILYIHTYNIYLYKCNYIHILYIYYIYIYIIYIYSGDGCSLENGGSNHYPIQSGGPHSLIDLILDDFMWLPSWVISSSS